MLEYTFTLKSSRTSIRASLWVGRKMCLKYIGVCTIVIA